MVPSAKHSLKYLIELSLNLFSLIAYTCVCWSLSRGHGGGGCLDFVLCFEGLVINVGFPPPPIILSGSAGDSQVSDWKGKVGIYSGG